jgi:hypothetical protein
VNTTSFRSHEEGDEVICDDPRTPSYAKGFSGEHTMRNEVSNISSLNFPVIKRGLAIVIIASLFGAGSARAQTSQSYVYPANGQSQEQMQKDTAECRSLAAQSSGYNPSMAQANAQPQSTASNSKAQRWPRPRRCARRRRGRGARRSEGPAIRGL